jgi:hypothetical protein
MIEDERHERHVIIVDIVVGVCSMVLVCLPLLFLGVLWGSWLRGGW